MFDADYWSKRYNINPAWDVGTATEPLIAYFDTLKDQHISILIPGCGNAYEAKYLLEKGFTDITIMDIVPEIIHKLSAECHKYGKHIKIICEDFFQHHGAYDLIIEQTFFCALHPSQRNDYIKKMHALLKPGGTLAGLLFIKEFYGDEPPFGGSMSAYRELFSSMFQIDTMHIAQNSIIPRQGSECFFSITAL